MKIILLCGSQGNQKALAHRIHSAIGLEEIVLWNGTSSRKIHFAKSLTTIWQKICTILTVSFYRRAWFGMLNFYEARFPEFPIEPSLICNDINDNEVLKRIADLKPDLVVVSGTNLLRLPLIETIVRYGRVMNLHTGIAPYNKGGPNCTNWCLYLREFGLIGSTVMWLDSGIDSGNIISTDRTLLNGSESFRELHIKVIDHAHCLYVEAIEKFKNGYGLPSVPQDSFVENRLFLSNQWGLLQMLVGLFNFYLLFRPGSKYLDLPKGVQLVHFKDCS
jgi:folate-dependent phosphoribosylglycinamide formyltransferase PurN